MKRERSVLALVVLLLVLVALPPRALSRRTTSQHRRDRSSNNHRASFVDDDNVVTLHLLEERLAALEVRLERRYQAKLDTLQQQHEQEMHELEIRLTEECERMVVDEAAASRTEDASELKRQRQLMTNNRANNNNNNALTRKVNKLETSLDKLTSALGCIDQKNSGKKSLIFDGCNVYIQNGKGNTDSINGVGNLILGYDEDTTCISQEFNPPQPCIRDGSHNLVVGMHHEYGSYGGVVAGQKNSITGIGASVTGGFDGLASANFSSVSGGLLNWAAAEYSSVQGGEDNAAFREYSSISGGFKNDADGAWTSILGGDYGLTLGDSAIVVGGFDNVATASFSIAVGGAVNVIESEHFVVLGGNGTFVPAGDDFDSLPQIYHQVLTPDQTQCACILANGTIVPP